MDQSEFEQHWTKSAPRVRAFLAAACRDRQLVDDCLQEVATAGWRKRKDFDPQRPFEAWLIGIARLVVLRHRRDLARSKLILAPDLLEQLETITISRVSDTSDQDEALAQCVEALGDSARRLLQIRYQANKPLAEVAELMGRSHGAVRTALTRIREVLRRCIESRLSGKTFDDTILRNDP